LLYFRSFSFGYPGKPRRGRILSLHSLTRTVFFYDSVLNDGSGKAYNSGDKARFLETGNIEYLGRSDDQVKINGQRVELGAVESAVLSCCGVKQYNHVVETNGSKALAAFVVGTVQPAALKEEVSRKAARHEVPHQVVMVETIPLTTAGKADRTALKKLLGDCRKEGNLESPTKAVHAMPGAIPRSPVQDVVREAVQEIFGKVDEERTFWEMGGTSLMAMTLDGLIYARTGGQCAQRLGAQRGRERSRASGTDGARGGSD
jgi:hypothetical protein